MGAPLRGYQPAAGGQLRHDEPRDLETPIETSGLCECEAAAAAGADLVALRVVDGR
ncbi:MAG TPA: hypothetical protein VNX70_17665 [Bryobacteraceae bacterium]|nr:hypothetical protein [Bryobacteraceae bacterium]